MNPRLLLLTLCQGLLLVNYVVFISIYGLVGLALAPVGWMATLPITGYVAGGAIATTRPSWKVRCRPKRRWCRATRPVAIAPPAT